jgi:hypothetical protein
MDSSDPQGELLPAQPALEAPDAESYRKLRAFFEREAIRSAEEIGRLKRQFHVLRTLVMGTLIGALVLSTGVGIFCFKQLRQVRNQLADARANLGRASNEFRKVREPALRSFLGSLQAFAQSHRDFQPVLDRYKPILYEYYPRPGPALSPAPGPAPKAPGK